MLFGFFLCYFFLFFFFKGTKNDMLIILVTQTPHLCLFFSRSISKNRKSSNIYTYKKDLFMYFISVGSIDPTQHIVASPFLACINLHHSSLNDFFESELGLLVFNKSTFASNLIIFFFVKLHTLGFVHLLVM